MLPVFNDVIYWGWQILVCMCERVSNASDLYIEFITG